MIISFLIAGLVNVLVATFNLIPDLPPTPETIVNGGDWIIEQFAGAITIVKLYLGGAFTNVVIGLLIAYFAFNQIYDVTLWVLRKLPFVNVK